MLIGFVGKPSVGKSTLFKALTLSDVEIASYPFTTIKPNSGVGYVKIDCVDKEFNVQCNPRNGYCVSGRRFVPVQIIDVAGLVPVLLMDEPASALDPISTAKIEELIFELKNKYTIIVVTHNMQQAARISDYTAFFYMGQLIEYEKTTKLFTNPVNKQTEDYITGRFG